MAILKFKITSTLNWIFLVAFVTGTKAQQIYSNGSLSTGTVSKSGVSAPAGSTWSELQNEIGNTTESNSLAGVGGVYTADETNSALNADDFVVPPNQVWNVNGIDVFVYQTNYSGIIPPVDQLRVQIFNGDPQFGGTLVAGNLTTNVIDIPNSVDTSILRIFNTTTPSPGIPIGAVRRIWKVRGSMNATLPSGTYWIVYQMHSTNNANSFFPPLTIPGIRGLSGWNAKQNVVATTALGQDLGWAPLFDDGIPISAPDFPLDLPFVINGTVTLGVHQNTFENSISIAPNPVKNVLFIDTEQTQVSAYEILDLSGRKVQLSSSMNAITEINVSNLQAGSYFLKLKSEEREAIKKFVKQ